MGKVILPNDNLSVEGESLFFLGGPIRGAPEWQNEAIRYLLKNFPGAVIANPRRSLSPDLAQYQTFSQDKFPRQRAWEWNYLKKAGKENKFGAIIFWLPGEVQHSCGKAYGAMTRVELGQWMSRYVLDGPVRLSIGTDGRFSEFDTILYDMREEYKINIPIFTSLEATCENALTVSGA